MGALIGAPELLLFMAASLLVLVSPGPVVIFVVTQSARHGVRYGLASVFGGAVGAAVYLALAVTGVASLLLASPRAFAGLKILGAVFLIGLGLSHWQARPSAGPELGRGGGRLGEAFARGLIVNLTNPKTAVFFLAYLPQFIDPQRAAPGVQMLALGGLFLAMGLLSDGLYAVLGARLADWTQRRSGLAGVRDRLVGSVFIILGLAAALG